MYRSASGFASILLFAALLTTTAAADDRDTCAKESGDVAIEACNRVINSGRYSKRDLATAYVNRGQEYYLKKDYDRAIADFTQAIRLDPKDAILAYGNRGNAWSAKDDSDRAIADYTQALKLDRKYTAAYTGRGLVREKKGDVKGALADYKAALAVPQKYQDGTWAHDTARARIAALSKQ